MSQTAILCISSSVAEKIRRHGTGTYPYECCGALFGRDADATAVPARSAREVVDLFPLVNRRDDSPHNRFSVPAEDVRAAERAAQAKGLDVVGWYHSHPDHPAQPSDFDREHAWPWYSYIILRVQNGAPQSMTSWRLRDDRAAFSPETVEIRNQAWS